MPYPVSDSDILYTCQSIHPIVHDNYVFEEVPEPVIIHLNMTIVQEIIYANEKLNKSEKHIHFKNLVNHTTLEQNIVLQYFIY